MEDTKNRIERMTEEVRTLLSDLVEYSLTRSSKLAVANAVYSRVSGIAATLLEAEKHAEEIAAKGKEHAIEPERKTV